MIGIVGVGSIGSRIADVFGSLGATVLGVKRDLGSVPESVDEIFSLDELHAILGRSDYAVAACPLTLETHELFDVHAFSSRVPQAVFVNIARAGVVDQVALVEAFQTSNLGGAALHVVYEEPLSRDSPLWDLENVLITPHMAGGSPHFARRCAGIFERYAAGALDEMDNRAV